MILILYLRQIFIDEFYLFILLFMALTFNAFFLLAKVRLVLSLSVLKSIRVGAVSVLASVSFNVWYYVLKNEKKFLLSFSVLS